MKKIPVILIILVLAGMAPSSRVRMPVDRVGFATGAWQMDSVMNRIFTIQGNTLLDAWKKLRIDRHTAWKTAICPHDDYTYAGWLYPAVLRNIKAPVVIILGVAHKAGKFGLEDRMVFDGFDEWSEPYGPVRVSPLREKIMNRLPKSTYVVHDSMQSMEHSVEAIVPFLQYYNRKVEIVPILVPYMSFGRGDELASSLSQALVNVMQEMNLDWGHDFAIVISNDAVHYGDEDWGGRNYAPYGCDSAGYREALAHEREIIDNCLTGAIDKNKLKRFSEYTVQDTNFRTYRWTWCGRFSVPFGLLTSQHLAQSLRSGPLRGTLVGYGNSVMQPPVPVEDLKMGKTAGASLRHWVGYAAIGYK